MVEWRHAVSAILGAPGTVAMLGSVDVGKTTLATALANAAVCAGRRAAIVDADIGQSDIGPPTTVGFGIVDHPVRRMTEVPLHATYFVGDTSPREVHSFLVEGIIRLVSKARALGVSMIVVDTTGWVEGPAAVAAKVREIDEAGVRHVVAIQRDSEVEPVLERVPEAVTVYRLRPDERARRRSAGERRAFREQRFARYFGDARPLAVHPSEVRLERNIPYAGRRVPPARVMIELPPRELRHRLVGLADDAGDLVALGTVAGVRPGTPALTILAPRSAGQGASTLQWGMLRVSPAGREERRPAVSPGRRLR